MKNSVFKNVLISVYDKSGIIEFAQKLENVGLNIFSTGKTAKLLEKNNIKVTEVSKYTEFPEILGGRVKTLHPKVFAGILAKRNSKEHQQQVKEYNIINFDIVVVNLYPFEKTILNISNDEDKILENIDIGGVSLIRAAAKNFNDVVVIVDPNDYKIIIEKIKNNEVTIEFRKYLAQKAFFHTSRYDSIIANWFLNKNKELDVFLDELTIGIKKVSNLRYGENPHQKAALYKLPRYEQNYYTLLEAEKIQGKDLSYNNYLDLDSAYSIIKMFNESACVIIKHNNPCGVAESKTIFDAYKKALSCDPVSAYGGIIAFNREVDFDTAKEVIKLFTECVIAPGFSIRARKVFEKKKNLILLSLPIGKNNVENEFRQIDGGILLQTKDIILDEEYKIVTKKHPTQQELVSLKFANIVAKQTKSNAIVLVKNKQTVGIGAGQMSRIDALKIAKIKMNQMDNYVLKQLNDFSVVLASDAFFPFRDIVDESAKIGVKAIIQPGGSIRDIESINAANEHGIAMVFTGIRHFKH